MAQDAGAIGCIFYNNVEGGLRPKVDDPSVRIFGHGISQSQGQLILDQFDSGRISKVEVIYKAEKGVFRNEMADQISTFSSWGLGPELELKPDVGAPGGYIYSTIPVSVRGSCSYYLHSIHQKRTIIIITCLLFPVIGGEGLILYHVGNIDGNSLCCRYGGIDSAG